MESKNNNVSLGLKLMIVFAPLCGFMLWLIFGVWLTLAFLIIFLIIVGQFEKFESKKKRN